MSVSSSSNSRSARRSLSVLLARSQRWQFCAWYRTTLGIEPPGRGRLGNALDGETVGGHPHAHALARVDVPGLLEGLDHDLLELRVDLVLLPEVFLETLHPFEVRDH